MRLLACAVVFVLGMVGSVSADRARDLEELADVLHIEEMVDILSDEGVRYGESLAEEMFGDQEYSEWTLELERIYEPSKMAETFREHFDPLMSDQDVTEALAFFTSPLGMKVTQLEMTARTAISDPDVQAAGEDRLLGLMDANDPIISQLEEYIRVNDLIDMNVTGSMNESYAFLSALSDAGAMAVEMTEGEILESVWGDEPQIREDTTQWLMNYLAMSYSPLDEEEIDELIEFSRTSEGQSLNRALFQAFNEVYMDISRRMGRGAARFILSEDI
ncbi:DUF2059 domain-containing protein [Falsihalocynthiibacter sp. SS001]|uniref:DUF2059 domain-containing protein n=1 Tax=Falsihalocynthiibacter sp. SS001 TaxID=3349698 RepID=UPI0036D277D4